MSCIWEDSSGSRIWALRANVDTLAVISTVPLTWRPFRQVSQLLREIRTWRTPQDRYGHNAVA